MRKTLQLSPSQALNRPLIHKVEINSKAFGYEKIQVIRRLGFHIGNFGFLTTQQAISELSELLTICPIPFTADWLLGLINLRGNLVPVFDLHQLLNLENQADKKQMLLILGEGEYAGAIVIDTLPVRLTFADADDLTHLPPLPPLIKPYVSSGYEKKAQLWFNFDHQGFFESLATQLAL